MPAFSPTGLQCIEQQLAPCVEAARRTFPDAVKRFQSGLPPSNVLSVTTRLHDSKGHFEQVFVFVAQVGDGTIDGHIGSDISLVEGYSAGQRIRVKFEDVLDWTISKPDGSEEGNLMGKYLESATPCEADTASAAHR